jgi:glycosyltransferase involved in cell wall biosynthesis
VTTDDVPEVSLVIPAFNEAAYLPRLLDTVDIARRGYRNGADRIEVIVSDNSSTDETPQMAARRGCQVEHVERRLVLPSLGLPQSQRVR